MLFCYSTQNGLRQGPPVVSRKSLVKFVLHKEMPLANHRIYRGTEDRIKDKDAFSPRLNGTKGGLSAWFRQRIHRVGCGQQVKPRRHPRRPSWERSSHSGMPQSVGTGMASPTPPRFAKAKRWPHRAPVRHGQTSFLLMVPGQLAPELLLQMMPGSQPRMGRWGLWCSLGIGSWIMELTKYCLRWACLRMSRIGKLLSNTRIRPQVSGPDSCQSWEQGSDGKWSSTLFYPARIEQTFQVFVEGISDTKKKREWIQISHKMVWKFISYYPSRVSCILCPPHPTQTHTHTISPKRFHLHSCIFIFNSKSRASLVAQWLRIRLPMQGTRVRALVREDPTCRGATKPMRHNYWACALEPASHNYWAYAPQLLKLAHLEPVLCNKRSHCNEKLAHRNKE